MFRLHQIKMLKSAINMISIFLLLFAFFTIICIVTRTSFWIYLPFVVIIGLSAGLMVYLDRWDETSRSQLFSALMIFLTAICIYNVAVKFRIIRFYDSYMEIPLVRKICDDGHFSFKMTEPSFSSPVDTSSYPLLSILSSSFILICNVPLPYATNITSLILGVATFAVILAFVRSLAKVFKWGTVIIVLSTWLLVTSPDAIAQGMTFYHRHLSLLFCFMLLYFMFHSYFKQRKPLRSFLLLTAFMCLILPLSHSAYPSMYLVSLLTLTLLLSVVKVLKRLPIMHRLSELKVRLPFVPSMIVLGAAFLWYLNAVYPCTLTWFFASFVHSLLFPKYKAGEITKIEGGVPYGINPALKPEPFTDLLAIRDLLLWVSALIGWVLLAYRFLRKGDVRAEVVFPLFVIASFVPIEIGFYIIGGPMFEFRYLLMPLIVFLAAYIYTQLIMSRRHLCKLAVTLTIVFLTILLFLSPYTHVYFPRHLYDPSVGFKEVGHPKPEYIYIKDFLAQHKLVSKEILSDNRRLLTIVLEPDQWKYVKLLRTNFGKQRTYIITFIDFKPTIGYHSPRAINEIGEMRSAINSEYCKVVSSGPYTIYYKP